MGQFLGGFDYIRDLRKENGRLMNFSEDAWLITNVKEKGDEIITRESSLCSVAYCVMNKILVGLFVDDHKIRCSNSRFIGYDEQNKVDIMQFEDILLERKDNGNYEGFHWISVNQ